MGMDIGRLESIDANEDVVFQDRDRILLSQRLLKNMAYLLSSSDVEIGGMIDIDMELQFERNVFHMGGTDVVSMVDYYDFEIVYHTHPFRKPWIKEIPSLADLNWAHAHALIHENSKWGDVPRNIVNLVFAPDAIYAIYVIHNNGGDHNIKAHPALRAIYNDRSDRTKGRKFEQLQQVLPSIGMVLYRYTRTPQETVFNNNPEDILSRWPESLEVYITPVEPFPLSKTQHRKSNVA